jgi:ribonuclease P protein component
MSDYTLPRSERLRSLTAIRRLFGEGRSGFVYPYRYVWLAGEQSDEVPSDGRGIEVMFSVPKKFHKRANKRNLLKRRTREAYRLSRESLVQRAKEQGVELQLALIYSTKECHNYKTVENAVQRILAQVCEHL